MLKTDTSGTVVNADIKLSNYATTWNTRLAKIMSQPGDIIVCTFSISDLPYICRILAKHSNGVTILAHERYAYQAKLLKKWYPEIRIYVSPYAHAKLVLQEPGLVWLSSENLGHTKKSFDASICIENEEVYSHYLSQVDRLLRNQETIEIMEDMV